MMGDKTAVVVLIGDSRVRGYYGSVRVDATVVEDESGRRCEITVDGDRYITRKVLSQGGLLAALAHGWIEVDEEISAG
jgi:hypothetical protein